MIAMTPDTISKLFAALSIAVSVSACSDSRLNGGYSEAPMRPMWQSGSPTPSNSQSWAADTSGSGAAGTQGQYEYRGGRDPVTGTAYRTQ